MTFAIWITGLPGCGKSTIARHLHKMLDNTEYLRLDEIRKKFVKDPKFTDEEREMVYAKFIDEGVKQTGLGKNVIYDATAHKLAWRREARSKISDFLEVYVRCPLGDCIKRETERNDGLVQAELYRKSLERKNTGKQFDGLGKVVGIDVEYEEEPRAELIINSNRVGPEEAARVILNEIKKRGWK